jgi:hypothetical protein
LFAFGQQASCWIGVVDPADWPSVMMTGTVQPRCVATPKSRSRRGLLTPMQHSPQPFHRSQIAANPELDLVEMSWCR